MMSADTRALNGLHVLECAHYIAGPRCAQILADHGAEVVKLEPPGGDLSRHSAPKHDGWSMYFAAHNRHKQSVVVDLKRAAAGAILEGLIRWADVIVTNYTPAAVERLGLDLASARRINPRIVVVRISAYGMTGSSRDVPGFDGTVQARSGLAHMVGASDGPPTITSVPLTDYLAAVEGALGALLALQRRDAAGAGQEVDVSMMDATSTVLGYLFAEVLNFGLQPMRSGSRAPYALTGAYPAQDGYVYIAPMGEAAWRALCALIGRSKWSAPGAEYVNADARLRDRDVVECAVGEWTRRLPRTEIIQKLTESGIPCGQVNSVAEVAVDPLLTERYMLQEVGLGSGAQTVVMPGVEIKLGAPVSPDHQPVVPTLGAHTRAVLQRLGLSADEVDQLRSDGVIVC